MPMMKLQEVAAMVEILENINPTDALNLVKAVERESRREFGTKNVEFYSRPSFIHSMINIGNTYIADVEVLEYVVRILITITERCPVLAQEQERISDMYDPKTQDMYDFLFSLKDSSNKKIKKLVAYSIPFFSQFNTYEKKWEYIISISRIAPREESMNKLRLIIEHMNDVVPDDIKDVIIDSVQNFMQTRQLHNYTRQLYIDMIAKLR